jgi:hypothetical protein
MEIMMDKEEKILLEIRRQAVIRADQCRREAQNRQDTQYTLDALQELTKLPRRELEAIAADVRAIYKPEDKNYFSVKSQFMMVSSGSALMCFLFWVFIHLIF